MNYNRLNIVEDGHIVKGPVENRGANPYVDDYVGFTWNNIHSSTYNCFIENTGHLDFVGAPSFSNSFVSPAFQTRTYYTGMQNQSKKFSLNLVFYQLTLAELNTAFHWLDRTLVSDFYFDYEPYWKYSCKLASIGTIEKYVTGRTMYRGRPCDLYLCRVPVQFETVYHPEAISAYAACKSTEEGEVTQTDPTQDATAAELVTDYSKNSGATYFPYQDYNADTDKWEHGLIQLIEPDVKSEGYWRFILRNPSAHTTYFKLHLYNVHSVATIHQYWNNDYWNSGLQGSFGEGDIDAYENSTCICNINLSLDDDIALHLHYNSEDGTVLCANQLIEQLRSNDAKIPCLYKDSEANIGIPGTNDPEHPNQILLEIDIVPGENLPTPQILIEYDTYEYMI